MVDFLRGDQSKEGDVPPAFRNRTSALGDIINAEPVVVNYAGGVPIIFQGANDGMLHVVDGRTASSVATRGQELWAYVPRLLHGSLTELATQGYSHKYFVDATPAAAEVTGVGSISRMLVGGLGKGGRGFYALNISSYQAATADDAASKVLWEFGQGRANMGYSFGKPLIVRTAAGWRVLVTSGYDNGTATGGDGDGYVWVLNPADGTVLATIDTGVGTAANPAGLAHLSSMANAAPDALVRYVYGGDLLGNVWRFDLDNNSADQDCRGTRCHRRGAIDLVAAGSGSGARAAATRCSSTSARAATSVSRMCRAARCALAWRDTTAKLCTATSMTRASIADAAQMRAERMGHRARRAAATALWCASRSLIAPPRTASYTRHDAASMWTDLKRGWYLDWPVDTQLSYGRVIGKPTLTRGKAHWL